jgi:hypothetical protein
VRVWETGSRHLWRLRQATSAEQQGSWYAARFHLDRLGRDELALQTTEACNSLTAPLPLGAAVTLAALQQREGRTPLGHIRHRHYRACYCTCLELDDWAAAEGDFARLRELKADTIGVWHQRAWAMLAQARCQKVVGVACIVQGQGPFPLGLLLSLWAPRPADTSAFRRVCAAMVERFADRNDATTREQLARTRLLIADELTEADTARLEQLGKIARDSQPDSAGALETYGAALYRSGQALHEAGQAAAAAAKYREAVGQLKAAVGNNGGKGTVWQHCFLAMAHHRLGHVAEAQAWLQKAAAQIEQAKEPGWESRVQWHYLHQEAARTLGTLPPSW